MSIASIGFSGSFMTYESDVLFALRYMIDRGIVGCNWLELPPGSFRCTPASLTVSHCQIEVHANYERVVSHPAEGEWVKLSRFRILSVDIECAGRKVRVLSKHAYPWQSVDCDVREVSWSSRPM